MKTIDQLYEELRAVIDNGNESMTHEDALIWVRGAHAPAPKLEDIEQYRLQMAGISTAAIGYWKEGDSIHPDYDTVALRDVAKLYAAHSADFQAARRYRLLRERVYVDPEQFVLRIKDTFLNGPDSVSTAALLDKALDEDLNK